jgi:hypothetical protein
VSRADVSEVVALAQRDMINRFHRVLPIEVIHVIDHNLIRVQYWNGSTEHWVPAQRIHGVWSLPKETIVVTG